MDRYDVYTHNSGFRTMYAETLSEVVAAVGQWADCIYKLSSETDTNPPIVWERKKAN